MYRNILIALFAKQLAQKQVHHRQYILNDIISDRSLSGAGLPPISQWNADSLTQQCLLGDNDVTCDILTETLNAPIPGNVVFLILYECSYFFVFFFTFSIFLCLLIYLSLCYSLTRWYPKHVLRNIYIVVCQAHPALVKQISYWPISIGHRLWCQATYVKSSFRYHHTLHRNLHQKKVNGYSYGVSMFNNDCSLLKLLSDAPNAGTDLVKTLNSAQQGLIEDLINSLFGLVTLCKENTPVLGGCVCGLLSDVFNTLSMYDFKTKIYWHVPGRWGLQRFKLTCSPQEGPQRPLSSGLFHLKSHILFFAAPPQYLIQLICIFIFEDYDIIWAHMTIFGHVLGILSYTVSQGKDKAATT